MSRAGRTGEGRRRLGSVLSSVAVALGCFLFLGGFLWGALLYEPYSVPSDSMSPTIKNGDRVLAQRIDGSEVRRGDVVVFHEQSWGPLPMVKRVVGVGGDTVACCDAGGQLTVNGKAIEEPYLRAGSEASAAGGIPLTTVPEGRLFLLGDERANSMDSSARLEDAMKGSVPRGAVAARVDAVAWPNEGMLEPPTGFAEIGAVSQPGPLRLVLVAVLAGAVLILGGAAYGPVAGFFGRRRRAASSHAR
ncbi:signal peptidase I [Streptomyces apocyni]|uniref:signal peptidase I n=1 Tax=Streptomyces apocyni TaxID=2654677 RepID=UPI0012E9AF45|nr:signal peptidase I [Streptomyces apocyni]